MPLHQDLPQHPLSALDSQQGRGTLLCPLAASTLPALGYPGLQKPPLPEDTIQKSLAAAWPSFL